MSMQPLTETGIRAPQRGMGLTGLAWIGGALATVAAIGIAAVLAVVFAATLVVISIMAAALLAVGGLAYRARKATVRPSGDPTLIEARNVGGHSWVAYGWDQHGR
jgi:hypothetical protein